MPLQCGAEGGTCDSIIPGTEVYYGAVTSDGPRYFKKVVDATSYPCSYQWFADPAIGYEKTCYRAPAPSVVPRPGGKRTPCTCPPGYQPQTMRPAL